MQVSSLSIDVSDRNATAHENVGRNVLHALGVERGLEFGAHEPIALSRVLKTEEMNSEHGHVEREGDDDQAENARHEVLRKEADRDILVITKEDPKLDQGQGSNPGNREQANPLDADSHSQAKTSHDEPEPPAGIKCPGRTEFVLVAERREGKSGKGGRNHQGRVEQD